MEPNLLEAWLYVAQPSPEAAYETESHWFESVGTHLPTAGWQWRSDGGG
jgi:hypothetical protein